MMAAESIWEWTQEHPWRALIVVIVLAILAFAFSVVGKKPRLDRNWVDHLAAMPTIDMHTDGFALGPAVDWSYDVDGPTAKDSIGFEANYSGLLNVWFVVEPQPGGGYAAHTLLIFEFADDRMIGVTVEARREQGEEYDAFQGLFNKFELAYIWATSKELLARRAVYLAKEVYVYPLQLTEEQKVNFLKALLAKTIEVSTVPRFYNTAVSNCTNELAKVARIPWHYSFILTGYSPQYLYKLKYIPGPDFAAVQAKARMDEDIRSWNSLSSADFDRALLAELRKRHGAGQAAGSTQP